MIRRLIFALFLLAGISQAQVVNQYYVATTGSDSNACTSGSPCATIAHAASILVLGTGGAQVNVAAGTYAGCFTTTRSGTVNQRIRFVSTTPLGASIVATCGGTNNFAWWHQGNFSDIIGFSVSGTQPGICIGIDTDGQFTTVQNNKIGPIPAILASCSNGGGGIVHTHRGSLALNGHDLLDNANQIDSIGLANGSNGTIHGIYGSVSRVSITNNLISRAGGWCVQFFHDTTTELVANNVLMGCLRGGIINTASDNGVVNNSTTFINNIVVHNSGEFGVEEKYGNGTGTLGVYRNNLFGQNTPTTGCSNPPTGVANCPFNLTFGTRIVSGTLTNATDGTVFVNYTGNAFTGDYHLKAASPAIGAGVAGACASGGISPCVPSADFAGVVRPITGAQDIGAYVFSSGAVPLVQFTPSPLAFGTVPVATSSTLVATLKNTGTANLTFAAATLTGTNVSSFKISSTTCVSPLAAAATCTYTIIFTPVAAGALTANLTLTDNASGSPHQLPLTGSGGTSTATFLPTSLSFGVVAPGASSATQVTTVTNSGTASLKLGTETISGTNAADFPFGGTGTCTTNQVLQPGKSCTISVKFVPTAVGARTANLVVASSDPLSPATIPLTGTGGAAVAGISPTSAACGSQQVGTSKTCQAFTLTNTGNINLTGITFSFTGTNAASFTQSNNCPGTQILAPLANCTITVFFKPTIGGALTGNLRIASNDPASPKLAALTGTGTVPITVTLGPSTVNFGNVLVGATSGATVITLTNTSAATVTITSITTASPFAKTTTCGATLPAGLNCTISVTATPSILGTVNGTVSVVDNATGSPHVASLSVTGTSPLISIAPSSLAFGNQTVGTTSVAKQVVLTSTGTAPLTGPGLQVLNVDEIQNLWPPSGWKPVCILPSCNPGGSGVPTATSQTFNNASPSLDGKSMKVSVTGPAFTNALWSYIAGADDSVTNLTADFWVQPSANASVLGSHEYDSFIFSTTDHTNYMFGTQCNVTANKWDVWDELNTAWVHLSGSTCSLPAGSFHHIIQTFHRVPGDTSCSSHACLHYDSITVDGVAVSGLPITEPSGPLPSNFVSAIGWHIQLDIGASGSGGQPVFENADKVNLGFSSISFTGSNPTDFTEFDSCGTLLAPNVGCNLNVTFKPGGSGARSATMSVASNAASSPTLVTLTGTGTVTAPAVCLSTSAVDFGPQPLNTTTSIRPVVVTNCGTANLVISAVNHTGDFTSTGCVGTVASQATCTISGTFTPTVAGTRTGTFSIVSNAASTPDVVSLTGFGQQFAATLTPSSLSFSSHNVGTSTVLTMSLLNQGNVSLTLNAPTITGGDAANFTGGTACTTLAPQSACVETVTFLPVSAGSKSATFNQSFSNGPTTVTAALTGTGVAVAPDLTAVPTALDFGNVTQGVASANQSVQVTNTGNSLLTFVSIALGGAHPGDYTLTDNCPATLNPGDVCTEDLIVTPGGTGTRAATLTFTDDGTSSPQVVTLTVNGVAAPTPRLTLDVTSLAFSPPSIQTTTTSAAQNITATNNGNANLVISSVVLAGTNPGDYTESDNCGTVTPGNSCSAVVNCVPTAAGSRTATLTFTSNASSSPDTATLGCTGFVGTPNLTLAVSSIDFGNQTVGTVSAPAAFTLTNTGLATATSVTVTASGDFTVTDTCSGSITAGSSCSATVRFTPTQLCGQTDPSDPTVCVSNVHTGFVTVVSNTSNSPQTVSLQGTATAIPPPPGPIVLAVGGNLKVGGRFHVGVQ